MIPMVVAGGLLGAIAKIFGTYNVGSLGPEAGATPYSAFDPMNWQHIWRAINNLSSYAMGFAVATLSAGIAYSIADRPGIVPGFILGYVCNVSKAGFFGGLIMAFFVGWLVNQFKKIKLPKAMEGLKSVLIIPFCCTLIAGLVFFIVVCKPLAAVMDAFQAWIESLSSGSLFVIGAVIGACLGFDMGGPVGKTASMAANAMFADDPEGIGSACESAKIIGGMTPALGIGFATIVAKEKFTKQQRDAGLACIPMGLCFITEGVLPFAAEDPLRVIPSSVIGSAVAGGMVMSLGCHTPAAHGGIFIIPVTTNWYWFVLALVVGSAITCVLYSILKRPLTEDQKEEDVSDDLDIDIH